MLNVQWSISVVEWNAHMVLIQSSNLTEAMHKDEIFKDQHRSILWCGREGCEVAKNKCRARSLIKRENSMRTI